MLQPRAIDPANRFTVPFGHRVPRLAVDAAASPRSKKIVLVSVKPNAGLQAKFRERIECMIEAMQRSYARWLMACYKANESAVVELANDAVAANEIAKTARALKRQWNKNFNQGSKELAAYFAKANYQRTDAQLKNILKRAGIAVEFKLTRAQRDIMASTVHESVSLIKSIPEQYHKAVEGIVMRGVQNGRDASEIATEMQTVYGKTKKRAGFIARDQNNKATAAFNRSRQLELGIDEAEWEHSHAGRQPRPTHVAAGKRKQKYKVSEGWYDPAVGKFIQPGELPNCRCTSRSVIEGFI